MKAGLVGAQEHGELPQARDGHRIDLLVVHKNGATFGVVAGDNQAYLHVWLLFVLLLVLTGDGLAASGSIGVGQIRGLVWLRFRWFGCYKCRQHALEALR